MQIELSDQTVRGVQTMLARTGGSADVMQYVDRTLKRAFLFDTDREVKRQNAGADVDVLDRLIDEPVEVVRATNS
jgi:hypothetical protein